MVLKSTCIVEFYPTFMKHHVVNFDITTSAVLEEIGGVMERN